MNILLHHRGGSYHIAGNFGGKKLSWISRSCGWLFMEIFSMKFGGCGIFWWHQWAIHESFLRETNLQKYPTICYIEDWRSLGQTNKIYCFALALCSICVWADGNYSLFITSKRYYYFANLQCYGHKKWACHCLEGNNDS